MFHLLFSEGSLDQVTSRSLQVPCTVHIQLRIAGDFLDGNVTVPASAHDRFLSFMYFPTKQRDAIQEFRAHVKKSVCVCVWDAGTVQQLLPGAERYI